MTKITIYHNNRCSKSRCALQLLEEQGIEHEVRYYLENAPDKKELKELLKKLNMKAFDLIRKNEAIFKENYKGKELSEEEWIEAMIEHPRLIERPILIKGDRAVIGRPTEKVEEFLQNQ